MAEWMQLLVTGITTGSVYALIALGYVTIYRTSRNLSLASDASYRFERSAAVGACGQAVDRCAALVA